MSDGYRIDFSAVQRLPTAFNVINEAVFRISWGRNQYTEDMIRVCIQPKPRWLPNRAWMWLLKKVLYIEEHRLKF